MNVIETSKLIEKWYKLSDMLEESNIRSGIIQDEMLNPYFFNDTYNSYLVETQIARGIVVRMKAIVVELNERGMDKW